MLYPLYKILFYSQSDNVMELLQLPVFPNPTKY